MNYYAFHIGDYASHTAHLTPLEDICYRRLLDLFYMTEGDIGDDVERIARRIRMQESPETVIAMLSEFFEATPAGYKNKRAQAEIDAYKDKADKASRAGKASAAKRVNGRSTDVQRTFNGRSTDVQPTKNQEPITNNQKPSSVAKATGDKSPLTPDEIIFGYGLPMLTNAGTAEKQARSFLGGLRKSHGDDALIDALRECIRSKPMQPLEWLAKVLPPKGSPPKRNKQELLEDKNMEVAMRFMEKLKNDAE